MAIRRFVRSGPRWLRITAAVVASAALLGGSAVIAVRVLAPAEVSTPRVGPFPTPSATGPGVRGVLTWAPLVVGGQLKISAAARQVRADGPVDARTERSPYWSYRRWPAQLVGVVVAGETVVSRWSDGLLVGLDGLTGTVAWQTEGPVPDQPEYVGGRTGLDTVYTPAGLHTAAVAGGAPVLIVRNREQLRGFDAASGRELWQTTFDDGDCRPVGFTTTGRAFVTVDACAAVPSVESYDVTTGAMTSWRPEGAGQDLELTPLSCRVAASDCPAVQTASGGVVRGWSLAGPAPAPLPGFDPAGTLVLGDTMIVAGPGPTGVTARSIRYATQLWQHDISTARPTPTGSTGADQAGLDESGANLPEYGDGPAPPPLRLLAVQPGRIHLLLVGAQLVTLDPRTGAELSRLVLTVGTQHKQKTYWQPGHVYAEAGMVCVERLAYPDDPQGADPGDFFVVQPMILAGT